FKPGEVVRRRDERGGPVAAPSAPPSGPPNGPNDDDNKNNPFKQKPNFSRSQNNDINDSNNPSKIADGMRSKAGARLGESREIYPARRGEKSSAVDFVRYDAAREELVVQYKGGGVYTFGGISAEDADTIEESESLGKALNDAKRNSTYTVK
ncbi:MAG: KTSC domain-containing protein, partial [bacterium]